MEMIQQLLMAAFATFVFSILVEKLTCVTIDREERKSKRPEVYSTKSRSKNKVRSSKKVRFASHDQVAFVVNDKLVKLDSINLPNNKQESGYDLEEVHLGANWTGEELMMCKGFGFHVELQAQTWLEIDGNFDDQINYDIALDVVPRKYAD